MGLGLKQSCCADKGAENSGASKEYVTVMVLNSSSSSSSSSSSNNSNSNGNSNTDRNSKGMQSTAKEISTAKPKALEGRPWHRRQSQRLGLRHVGCRRVSRVRNADSMLQHQSIPMSTRGSPMLPVTAEP